MASILIVEDDRNSAEMMAAICEDKGHACALASDLADARQQLVVHEPDIILLDLQLPDGSGLDLFGESDAVGSHAEVILITGHASVETSVQALRLGASDYLIKPVNVALLERAIARALVAREEAVSDGGGWPPPELAPVPPPDERTDGLARMRGGSAVMREIYRQIRKVAPTSVSVLVVGESGTGKELVADAIHRLSRRRNEPFKAINCGAISEQLIESELFGHEKGSFTGAIKQHKGIFEQADGGTLFLDEITEMPAELQVRLLRVLETGVFSRVGSDVAIATDVRIVAATNRDPYQAVADGLLREDLYYRLNVFQIELPPLRERVEDIPLIAEAFLTEMNEREQRRLTFAPAAIEALMAYDWPGNVRELRNVVNRAAILTESEAIGTDSIPTSDSDRDAPAVTPATAVQANDAPVADTARIAIHVGMTLAEVERLLIMATLEFNEGAREKSAQMLGISAKTLYNRLRQYED
ncbi:MAG: sigma-54 dependent transcriptional regulator [Burkholderiaceae bacterium]